MDQLLDALMDLGPNVAPQRIAQATRVAIRTTRQRRVVIGPWRTPDMNRFIAYGAAAAVVVLAVLIGFQVFGRNVGGPGPTVTPSPSSTPSPSPSPSPAAAFPPAGELAAGRHSVTIDGVSFSFELPTADWFSSPSKSGGYIQVGADNATTPAWMIFWSPDNVYADPCAQTLQDPPVGPSAANLAAAVSALPGTDSRGPTDVTVGGLPAKHVVVTVHEDVGCAAEDFYLWWDQVDTGRFASKLPTTIKVWIVDVGGTRIFIESEELEPSFPDLDQVIAGIVNSIQFE